MNSNFTNIDNLIDEKCNIFRNLPENGKFIWKKGVNCGKLLNKLPLSQNNYSE